MKNCKPTDRRAISVVLEGLAQSGNLKLEGKNLLFFALRPCGCVLQASKDGLDSLKRPADGGVQGTVMARQAVREPAHAVASITLCRNLQQGKLRGT